MVKLLLVAPVNVPSLAANVYEPALLITILLNDATPAAAATESVVLPVEKVPLLRVRMTVDALPEMTLP